MGKGWHQVFYHLIQHWTPSGAGNEKNSPKSRRVRDFPCDDGAATGRGRVMVASQVERQMAHYLTQTDHNGKTPYWRKKRESLNG